MTLSCAGGSQTTVAAPQIVALAREGNTPINLATVDLDAGQSADNGFNFRVSDERWIYNLSTSSLQAGSYVIEILLADGRIASSSCALR